MKTKEKRKTKKAPPRLNAQVRKDMFTWVHRYLRLHSELLVDDEIYKKMFEYHRSTLAAYVKKELKLTGISDGQLNDLIDTLADTFNETGSDFVEQYKPLVDELYRCWKANPEVKREIRI